MGEILGCLVALVLAGQSAADEVDLGALRRQVREAATVEERVEALRELARVPAVEGLPSKAAASVLALGLEDESAIVRAEAIGLLVTAHREVAVQALTRALGELPGEFADISRAAQKGNTRNSDRGAVERLEEILADARALIDALGTLPDDRCVKSLATFWQKLPMVSAPRVADSVVRSLTRLGSREAWEAALRLLPDLEGRAGRGAPRTPGQQKRGTPLERVQAVLVGAGTAAGCTPVPETGESSSRDWRDWWQEHRARFPARLGRIDPRGEQDPAEGDGRP